MREQSFWFKAKASFRGKHIDPAVTRCSTRLAAVLFWLWCGSVMYSVVKLAVPTQLSGYSAETRYYFKVFIWFCLKQITANWACVKFIDSSYTPSSDHGPLRTSHTGHAEANRPMTSSSHAAAAHNGDVTQSGGVQSRAAAERRAGEGDGLRWKQTNGNSSSASRHFTDSFCIDLDLSPSSSRPPDHSHAKRTHAARHAKPDSSRVARSGQSEPDERARRSLAWHYCVPCGQWSPPRAHHCTVCARCVLRRDHHCWLLGTCIGLRNQRHFIVLTAYIAAASLLATPLLVGYLRSTAAAGGTGPRGLGEELGGEGEGSEGGDSLGYFLPISVYRWLEGRMELERLVVLTDVYALIVLGTMSAAFLLLQVAAILRGKTTHELLRSVKVRCTASMNENVAEVFGVLWGFNFLFPAHIVFRQNSDGLGWKNLKPA